MKRLLLFAVLCFALSNAAAQAPPDTVIQTIHLPDGRETVVRTWGAGAGDTTLAHEHGLPDSVRYDAEGVPIHPSPDSFYVSVPLSLDTAEHAHDCRWIAVPKTDGSRIVVERKKLIGRLMSKTDYVVDTVPPPPLVPASYDVDTLYFVAGLKPIVIIGEAYRAQDTALFRVNAAALFTAFKADLFWGSYWKQFNWLTVLHTSPSNGVRHDSVAADCGTSTPAGQPRVSQGVFLSPLDPQYDYGGTHRLLYCSNNSLVQSLLTATVPTYAKAMILVNSPYYGGSGGTYPCGSTHSSSAEIMIHEFGHSFAGLADEYGGSYCTGVEKPNVTQNLASLKWESLKTPGIPIPTANATFTNGGVGAYNGGNYCNNGWYRPSYSCKMRTLNAPLCKVCMATFRNKLYTYNTSYIASNTSTVDTVAYPAVPVVTLKVPYHSVGNNKICETWTVAGNVVNNLNNLPEGIYDITYNVKDTAYYRAYLDNDPEITLTWHYKNTDGGSGPVDVDHADYQSNTLPASMAAGASGTFAVTWINDGTTTWDNTWSVRVITTPTFGIANTALSGTTLPDATKSVTVNYTAPTAAGTYTVAVQLYKTGVGFVNEPMTAKTVTVVASDNALYVTRNVPSTVVAGQTFAGSFTFKNTGANQWAAGTSAYVCRTRTPSGNSTFGVSQIGVTSITTTGNDATFSATFTAPATAGTHYLQMGMYKISGALEFGNSSPYTAITVTAPATDAAAHVSNTIPTTMNAGQTYPVTVTMSNPAGGSNATWTQGSHYLATADGSSAFGFSQVLLPSLTVVPNTNAVFSFNVMAPSHAGVYSLPLKMKNTVTGLYIGTGVTVTVTVSAQLGVDNTGIGTITGLKGGTYTAGQLDSVVITFPNTGTTTFTAGQYQVLNVASGANAFGVFPVTLAANVPPGGTATFNAVIVPPSTAGTYNLQCRVKNLMSGVTFGSATALKTITVASVSTSCTPVMNAAKSLTPVVGPQAKKATVHLSTAVVGATYKFQVRQPNYASWSEKGTLNTVTQGYSKTVTFGFSNKQYILRITRTDCAGSNNYVEFYVTPN